MATSDDRQTEILLLLVAIQLSILVSFFPAFSPLLLVSVLLFVTVLVKILYETFASHLDTYTWGGY